MAVMGREGGGSTTKEEKTLEKRIEEWGTSPNREKKRLLKRTEGKKSYGKMNKGWHSRQLTGGRGIRGF